MAYRYATPASAAPTVISSCRHALPRRSQVGQHKTQNKQQPAHGVLLKRYATRFFISRIQKYPPHKAGEEVGAGAGATADFAFFTIVNFAIGVLLPSLSAP